jgi:hypothetical protein
METHSPGAPRAPGASGTSGISDPRALLSSCSLHITHVCGLPALLRPSESAAALPTTRPPAAPPFEACESSAVRGRPCASARSQRRRGLRPQHVRQWRRGLRRHRRLPARPSAALRCCRIRLHWPATTPRPRAIPTTVVGFESSFKMILKLHKWSFKMIIKDPSHHNRTQSVPRKGVRDMRIFFISLHGCSSKVAL